MKMGVDDGAAVPFEAKDCKGVGVGDGVGVVKGEGLGVGPGVGVGAGEGVGVACSDTFQVQVCIPVPFSFVATTDTFHEPTAGLVFVQDASVTPFSVSFTTVPFSSQLTFTTWSIVTLNVLVSPSTS